MLAKSGAAEWSKQSIVYFNIQQHVLAITGPPLNSTAFPISQVHQYQDLPITDFQEISTIEADDRLDRVKLELWHLFFW